MRRVYGLLRGGSPQVEIELEFKHELSLCRYRKLKATTTMDKETFLEADKHVEEITELLVGLMEGEEFSAVRKALGELSMTLRDDYSVTLSVGVEAFGSEQERSLPLLRTGLSTHNGQPPHVVWGDSSRQKYIVDGEMVIVPHDHCPGCWASWDFKFRHPTCSSCGARLGVEVKVLLDTNCCPSCERETVSPTNLNCSECGFEIEPSLVVWG